MSSDSPKYGVKDNSYKAAGELAGLTKLVDSFYDFIEALPEAGSFGVCILKI
jgi:hemoglobin